jgi:hypothetical protein
MCACIPFPEGAPNAWRSMQLLQRDAHHDCFTAAVQRHVQGPSKTRGMSASGLNARLTCTIARLKTRARCQWRSVGMWLRPLRTGPGQAAMDESVTSARPLAPQTHGQEGRLREMCTGATTAHRMHKVERRKRGAAHSRVCNATERAQGMPQAVNLLCTSQRSMRACAAAMHGHGSGRFSGVDCGVVRSIHRPVEC